MGYAVRATLLAMALLGLASGAVGADDPWLDFPAMDILWTGIGPDGLHGVDVNGDGLTDLLAESCEDWDEPCSRGLMLTQNDPPGTGFTDGNSLSWCGATRHPLDLNGDPYVDLVVTGYLDCLYHHEGYEHRVLLGTPDGATPFQTTQVVQGDDVIRRVAVSGQFDGDPATDVIGRNRGFDVQLFHGGTGGTMTPGPMLPLPRPILHDESADLDRDGVDDVLLRVDAGSDWVVYFGSEDGTFRAGPAVGRGTPLLFDWNGDDRVDVLLADAEGVIVHYGSDPLSFDDPQGIYAGTATGFRLLVADLNQDAHLDLIVGGTVVLLGDGAHGLVFGSDFGGGYTTRCGSRRALVDYDGDGRDDLICIMKNTSQDSGDAIVGMRTGANGLPEAPTRTPFDLLVSWYDEQDRIVGADVDGDGLTDVAILGSSRIEVALGDGEGGFLDPIVSPLAVGTGSDDSRLELGHVDGDGYLDAVYRSGSWVVVAPGDGAGGFDDARTVVFQSGLIDFALVDVAGSADLDLVLTLDRAGGKIATWVGDSTMHFEPGPVTDTPIAPGLRALADFDGDGRVDIAIQPVHAEYADAYVLSGDGTGAFVQVETFTTFRIEEMAAWNALDDAPPVLLVRGDEGILGRRWTGSEWSWFDAGRRGPRVVSMASADLDGLGADELVAVTYWDHELDVRDAVEQRTARWVLQSLGHVLPGHVNDDGRVDLIVVGDEIITLPNLVEVPTPVILSSFDAELGDEGVVLRWRASLEIDHAGYHVYRRSMPGGKEERLTSSVIRSRREFVDRSVEAGAAYEYALGAVDRLGREERVGSVRIAIDRRSPVALRVLSVRPNPFSEAVSWEIDAPPGSVTLRVYDAYGRLVREQAAGTEGAGLRRLTWDGRDARGRPTADAIYFYTLESHGQTVRGKILRLTER